MIPNKFLTKRASFGLLSITMERGRGDYWYSKRSLFRQNSSKKVNFVLSPDHLYSQGWCHIAVKLSLCSFRSSSQKSEWQYRVDLFEKLFLYWQNEYFDKWLQQWNYHDNSIIMINCNDNDDNDENVDDDVDDEDGSVTVNDLSGSDVTAGWIQHCAMLGWIQPLKTKQKSAAGEQHTLSSSSSS